MHFLDNLEKMECFYLPPPPHIHNFSTVLFYFEQFCQTGSNNNYAEKQLVT